MERCDHIVFKKKKKRYEMTSPGWIVKGQECKGSLLSKLLWNTGNNDGKLNYYVQEIWLTLIIIVPGSYSFGEKIRLVHMKHPKCLWHILSDPEEKLTIVIFVIFLSITYYQ